jgi:hypothetical protein
MPSRGCAYWILLLGALLSRPAGAIEFLDGVVSVRFPASALTTVDLTFPPEADAV